MHLGYIKDLATLCGYERDSDGDKFLGCWTVNPTTGALGASAATAIPGRGRRTALDAQNCIDGYCIGPTSSDGKRSFFAASTSGSRTAILTSDLLYIFETSTKNKLTQIELAKHGAPDETNVGNMPWDILYNGDTVFVIGADAGPFIAAWVFKDNGDRAGQVRAGAGAVNIFRGGYGILGHDKIALADAGLQNMTTVIGANVGKQNTKRTASYAPCRRRQFSDWTEGQDTQTGACKTVLDAKYRPETGSG